MIMQEEDQLLAKTPDQLIDYATDANCATQLAAETWHALCEHHYEYTPLPGEAAHVAFAGVYYYAKKVELSKQITSATNQDPAQLAQLQYEQQRYIQQARHYGNYFALRDAAHTALRDRRYTTAVTWAEQAGNRYGSAGLLLLVDIHLAITKQEDMAKYLRKYHLQQAAVCLQCAYQPKILDHVVSRVALKNSRHTFSETAFQALKQALKADIEQLKQVLYRHESLNSLEWSIQKQVQLRSQQLLHTLPTIGDYFWSYTLPPAPCP